jgi:DNA polymerase (family X)
MKIVNQLGEDYHMHTVTYSDGMNTVDEIVKYAGVLGLAKIAITDHSQVAIDRANLHQETWRSLILNRWQNVHNDVEVIFGVEGDLLNENGDICDHIQGIQSDFLILSAHKEVYQDNPATITDAYLKAIEKHGDKIKFLGHPYMVPFGESIDMKRIVQAANERDIGLEVNGAYIANQKICEKALHTMLENAQKVYVNSDAHTLHEMKTLRQVGFDFLRQHEYI